MSLSVEMSSVDTLAEVAELYGRSAETVRRLVGHGVRAPEAVVEDACQVAWGRLIAHRRQVCREGAIAWLVRTAIREAFRTLRRDLRLVALDELVDEDGERLGLTPVDEILDHRLRLWQLASLPARQRRLLWLQAFGFSYAEMAAETGASLRAVERQLCRGRRRLAGS